MVCMNRACHRSTSAAHLQKRSRSASTKANPGCGKTMSVVPKHSGSGVGHKRNSILAPRAMAKPRSPCTDSQTWSHQAWSCGLFGYFPTYPLGNLYAAQFAATADKALGGLDQLMQNGNFAPLRQWLHDNVHQHGRRYSPAELCERATGAPLSSEHFTNYLERKLRHVYRIA